jgi:hypothetical protein
MVVEGLGISSHNVVAGIGASWRDASTAAIVDDIDDNRLRPTDGVVGNIVAYLHGEFWEQYQGVFGISRHIFVKSLLDSWIKDHRKLAENGLLQEAVDGIAQKFQARDQMSKDALVYDSLILLTAVMMRALSSHFSIEVGCSPFIHHPSSLSGLYGGTIYGLQALCEPFELPSPCILLGSP